MNCRTIAFATIVALTLFQMGHGLEWSGGALKDKDVEFDPTVSIAGGVMNLSGQPRQCTGKFQL